MLNDLQAWHWLILGLLLGGGELLFSGAYCLWISVAALLTAILAYFFPDQTILQVLTFAILSIVLVLISRKLFPGHHEIVGNNQLNRRADKLIGHILTLEQPIINGRAQVRIGDSVWTVQGDDSLMVGEKIQIISIDGTLLIVEKVKL